MRLLDFRTDPAPEAAEIVVVGSGPAGMTVAAELTRAGRDVLVLESGPDAETVNRVVNVGDPRTEPQEKVRRRELGGTSTRWIGRCTPLDDVDYEEREWIPASGWPIAPKDIAPFLPRAAEIFRLGEQEYGDGVWALLGLTPPEPALDPEVVTTRFWQFSRGLVDPVRPTRFATDLPNDSTVLTGATATRLVHDDGRVSAVEVASLTGKRGTIRAGTVVLAGGAIETPRLMLVSGLGGELTGRYLMDHPGLTIGSVEGDGSLAVRDRFGVYHRRSSPAKLVYVHGFALPPEVQRAEGLVGASCWLDEFPSERDPFQAALRVNRRRKGLPADTGLVEYWREQTGRAAPRHTMGSDLAILARHPLALARALSRLRRGRPPLSTVDRVDLYSIVEQVPDPESRVTLSDELDPLGVPVPRIDWRLHDEERVAMVRLLELVGAELERIGLPAPVPAPWMADYDSWRDHVVDRAHQIGTTRMAASPDRGVVDADCRVFGSDNLFVAGSSVFPTASHANPTLMIVALAVRLADHLASIVPPEASGAVADASAGDAAAR